MSYYEKKRQIEIDNLISNIQELQEKQFET